MNVSEIGIVVELKNGQSVARQLDAIEAAGAKVESMGRRVASSTSSVDSTLKRQAVTLEEGRRAWAAAGGDMAAFARELAKIAEVAAPVPPVVNRVAEAIVRMRAAAAQRTADSFAARLAIEMDKADREATKLQRGLEGVTAARNRMQAAGRAASEEKFARDLAAAEREATKLQRGLEGMAAARRRMQVAGMESQIAQLDPFQKQLSAVEANAAGGAKGLGRLENAIMGVATRAAGAHPVVGNFLGVLGSMAVSAPQMIAITAGLAALAIAWDKITDSSRKAKEAQVAARNAANAGRYGGAFGEATVGRRDSQAALDKIRQEIEVVERAIEKGAGRFQKKLNELRKTESDLVGDVTYFAGLQDKIRAEERQQDADDVRQRASDAEQRQREIAQRAKQAAAIRLGLDLRALEIDRLMALSKVRADDAETIAFLNATYEAQAQQMRDAHELSGQALADANALTAARQFLAIATAQQTEDERRLNEEFAKVRRVGTVTPTGNPFGSPMRGAGNLPGGPTMAPDATKWLTGWRAVFNDWKADLASAAQQGFQSFGAFMADTLTGAKGGFDRFARDIGRTIAGMATNHVSNRVSSNITNGAGAMAGVGPFGVFVAAAGIMLSAGQASAEAAKQQREAAIAQRAAQQEFRASLVTWSGVGSDLDKAIAAVRSEGAGLRQQARGAFSGGERSVELQNVFRIEEERIAQLKREAEATKEATAALKAKESAEREGALNQDLQVRNLIAAGLDDEAARRRLQLQHEAERAAAAGLDATTRAFLDFVQAMEKEALIAQQAAEAERKLAEARERATQRLEDLTARWLRATGSIAGADDAIMAAQQRRERADYATGGATPAELAMLDVVQGIERAQSIASRALQEQTSQAEAQTKLLQDQLQVAERQFEETRRVADSLAEYGRSLQLSDASPLSPVQRLAYARSERDRLFALAQGGDAQAAGRFQGAADAYLREQRSFSASGVDSARGFAETVAMVETLASMYGQQATVEEQMVAALKEQLATAQAQLDELRSGNALAEATKAEWIAALERQQSVTSGPTADLLTALESIRGSVDESSRLIVDAQAQSLAVNRNALDLATQRQIEAIRSGADLQTLAQHEQIRQLAEQRLSYDNNAVREIMELGRIAGFGSDQVRELIQAREAFDSGIQAQIDALGGLGVELNDIYRRPGGPIIIGPPELPVGAATDTAQQATTAAVSNLAEITLSSIAVLQAGFNALREEVAGTNQRIDEQNEAIRRDAERQL